MNKRFVWPSACLYLLALNLAMMVWLGGCSKAGIEQFAREGDKPKPTQTPHATATPTP